VRALAGLALVVACSGDGPVNPCPTGDCTLPSNTIVKWQFNSYPDWKFTGDTCIDLGISTVRVEVVSTVDPSIADLKDAMCGDGQATLLALPEGPYTAYVTPLDAGLNPLVGASVMAQLDAPSTSTVNVPYTAWTGAFTGTLLFRLSWAGATCTLAVPPVTTQTLTLLVGDQPSNKLLDSGQKLDGTDARPCRALTDPFAQFVEQLPFGPVALVVVGKDENDAKVFEHRFDTFVGAGENNPTITFDLPPPAAPLDSM